jgi:flagellar biosynthesis protein
MSTNKPDEQQAKKAVAIRYEKDNDNAPKVIAKGRGIIAENILSKAKQHSVPVYQNKTLTAMLMAVELDKEIPPELYQAVAEILAYVYRVDKKMGHLFK